MTRRSDAGLPVPSRRQAGVVGNRRLTSMLGVVLLTLLILQIASAIFFALLSYNVAIPNGPTYDIVRPVHFFVGFMLLPLIGLKLASTGWKLVRYYTRSRAYQAEGAPSPVERLIAPLLVGSAVSLTGSGVEMWSFRNQFGLAWTAIHNVSAFVFTTALVVHVLLHVRAAHRDAAADVAGVPQLPAATGDGVAPPTTTASPRSDGTSTPSATPGPNETPANTVVGPPPLVTADSEPLGGVRSRRAVLGAGLAAGLTLGAGASGWPFSGLGWLMPMHVGAEAFDFPVMNYEGGAQRVDIARWRLRVDGTVRTPLELTEADILALPTEEHSYAINCVDGWTATRTWRGVPATTLLAMAGVDPDWGHVDIRSTSGYHWDHRRADLTLRGALLCTHINGRRLNDDHGYPVRLIVPGLVGKSNIKWIDGLEVGFGGPQLYIGPHLDFSNPTVTGRVQLPRNPAGRRP